MENANAIVTDALQELVVQASEAAIPQVEAQTAIRYMNRMMDRLASRGINLGYTKVNNLGDPVTVPDGAVSGVVTNLAVEIGGQYDVPISQGLANRAMAGMDAMIDISFTIIPTSFPDTAPKGSGNTGGSFGTYQSPFYPSSAADVLTEGGNAIELESGT